LKRGEKEISDNQLTPIPNRFPEREYFISIELPEFTCKCPISGYPDFAVIRLKYVPDQICVELKSLKLYINSFRDEYIFHEEVPNQILGDLVTLLHPKWMEVVGDFYPRGNVKTVITVQYNQETGYKLSNSPPVKDGKQEDASFI